MYNCIACGGWMAHWGVTIVIVNIYIILLSLYIWVVSYIVHPVSCLPVCQVQRLSLHLEASLPRCQKPSYIYLCVYTDKLGACPGTTRTNVCNQLHVSLQLLGQKVCNQLHVSLQLPGQNFATSCMSAHNCLDKMLQPVAYQPTNTWTKTLQLVACQPATTTAQVLHVSKEILTTLAHWHKLKHVPRYNKSCCLDTYLWICQSEVTFQVDL